MTTNTTASLSRRRLLASVPAAAAAMAPVAATATTLSDRSTEDPALAALAAHKAAYAEIAAISNEARDKTKRRKDIDQHMSDALWRSDAKLKVLLITMPTTIFGLACVLQHLARPENNDPRQSNILIGACDGPPDLCSAAENYLAHLSAAVFAMNGRAQS
jgi:hypothetical protein